MHDRRDVLKGAALMAWWAGGNGRQPVGPQTREAQRLDHRLMGTTRAGTGPAPSQNEIIVTTVVVHGTGPTSGVFIYNGTPGKGNPPQIAMVPTGVTTDPYGNAITSSKILMQGNVITESGGIFRTAAAAPLIQLDGPHNAYLQYNGSAVLSETLAPLATSDGLGNTVQGGITAYLSQTSYANLKSGRLTFADTVNAAFSGGIVGLNTIATADDSLAVQSPLAASTDIQSNLFLQRAATPGPAHALITNADLIVQTPGTPAQPASGFSLHSDVSGFPKVKPSLAGDTNDYFVGENTILATGASQIVNSTSNVAVTGLTAPVGIGTYRYHAKVVWTQGGTASNQKFGITGPATSSALFSMTTVNTSSVTTIDGRTSNSLVTVAEAQGGTAFVAITEIDGWATFTAAGTLAVAVACTVAANTFTVNNPFCFLDLRPIT